MFIGSEDIYKIILIQVPFHIVIMGVKSSNGGLERDDANKTIAKNGFRESNVIFLLTFYKPSMVDIESSHLFGSNVYANAFFAYIDSYRIHF